MGADAVHPTDRILQAYGLGKLDNASAESVSKHLEDCDACQRRVAELSSDSFLGRLRGAQGRPDSPGPAVSPIAGLSMLDDGSAPQAPPPDSTLPPGLAEHPDYEIVRELGQGGMGTVYLAKNRLMGRPEVLKVVSSHLIKRRGVLDRFLGEIRNAARLHHTNIVTAHAAMRFGESIVFAMEYVEGLDLAKLVKARGPLPVPNACNYAHQAAMGLQHAHEDGMVHRDIKPGNLMLAKQGNRALIKVLDFGLAKVRSEGAMDGGLTHEGQMLGTPEYVAPEQTVDARKADIRADIYSLGCTLYYLLTGNPPFQATSLYELLQAHHSMDALPLNLARPEVPVELAALVARMMAKEPERRFQTPADVAAALTPVFKKGHVGLKEPNAELSQAGQSQAIQVTTGAKPGPAQPMADRTTAAAASSKKPRKKPRSEAIWDSLIESTENEPIPKVAPAVAVPRHQQPSWFWPVLAAGILLLASIGTWAVVLRVKTPNGNIELVNLPEDAEVLIDGKAVSVTWPAGGKPAVFGIADGKHKITVKKDGMEISGDEVTVQAGGKAVFVVRVATNFQPEIVKPAPAAVAVSARTKAILDALEKPVPLKFLEDTPLEEFLKDVKRVTHGFIGFGIPIYVDPIGLQEAEKSMTSTVRNIDLRGPLGTTLSRALGQLDLAYYVKDDVVIITSEESIDAARKESWKVLRDPTPANKTILDLLELTVPMHFEEDTPLENALASIAKTAKHGNNSLAKRIYVDPIGLQEAEKAMTSTIRNLALEGVTLKTTLRLLLKQLDMAYVVKDGVLIITSGESVETVRNEPSILIGDQSPGSKEILNILEKRVPMSFNEDTPLENAIEYIKKATKNGENGLDGLDGRIDVDQKGLQHAEKSMTSTVRNLDLEGVPLKTTLRLLLKQLDLGYIVKDGLLIITSLESLRTKPK